MLEPLLVTNLCAQMHMHRERNRSIKASVYQNCLRVIFDWHFCSCQFGLCLTADCPDRRDNSGNRGTSKNTWSCDKSKGKTLHRLLISPKMHVWSPSLFCHTNCILASHCYQNLQKQKAKSLYKESWIILAREMMLSLTVVLGKDWSLSPKESQSYFSNSVVPKSH